MNLSNIFLLFPQIQSANNVTISEMQNKIKLVWYLHVFKTINRIIYPLWARGRIRPPFPCISYEVTKMVTGIFLPGKFPRKVLPRLFSPRNIPLMESMHGNNVVWLCEKYAADANLFRLKSSILTRAKRATNRNNVATEKRS